MRMWGWACLGALAACGGKAVIDPGGGVGGAAPAGGSGAGSGEVASSGSVAPGFCDSYATCCDALCGELLPSLPCFDQQCFCEEPTKTDPCTTASLALYECLIATGSPSVTCVGGEVTLVCGFCDEELEAQNFQCGAVECVEP